MRHFSIHRTLLVAICLMGCLMAQGKHFLFKNGKSSYSIILRPTADATEKTAASELQEYIRQISGGVTLPISTELKKNGKNQIVIGVSPNDDAIDKNSLCEDLTYESQGSNIYIYGNGKRGTMYGVFTFLENELGIRWYTPKCTVVPQKKKWGFDKLSHSEHPTVNMRQCNYYTTARENGNVWNAHNKINMTFGLSDEKYGGTEVYWGCHTMPIFVSFDLFDEHPEFFCMRNGERKKDGQLCLSNPEVLKRCKEGMLAHIRRNPHFRIYSLSQADNFDFCECDECKAIEAQYGYQHSGIIVWFVNQVADYIKEEFPDKFIGTFAYQYGRKPPVGIVPRDNVVIRLCSIECCYAHAMDDPNCEQNKTFVDDLNQWASIAPHLFIWDYIVNYMQYMAPFPNFNVLAPNIRTLRDNHAIGIFDEAQYQSNGADFQDLRLWVSARLLWNPDQEVEPLVKDFIDGYYGECAGEIWKYYQMCQALVTPDRHFGIYIDEFNPTFPDSFLEEGMQVLNNARQMAKSDEMRDRVDQVRLQILYLKSARHGEESKADGTTEELITLARKYNAMMREGEPLEKGIQRMYDE